MRKIKNYLEHLNENYNGRNYNEDPNIQLVNSIRDVAPNSDPKTALDYHKIDMDGIIDAIKRGADINYKFKGKSPLDLISMFPRGWDIRRDNIFSVVNLLLSKGSKFSDSAIVDTLEKSSSDLDEFDIIVDLVKIMIENGVDVDYQDKNGHTAIMIDIEVQSEFCNSGGNAKFDTRIFEMLVAAGANLCLKNNDDETFWDMQELYDNKKSFLKRINKVLEFYEDQKNVQDWKLLKNAESYNL